jgi:IS66 Orf2 like protein
VIGPTGAVRVMVATKPVDFRKGAEGLAALVRETMGVDPFSGAVYVFRAKRADRIKLVYFDGTGVCLLANDQRRRGAADGGTAAGASRRPRLAPRARRSRDACSDRGKLIQRTARILAKHCNICLNRLHEQRRRTTDQ